MAAGGQGGAGEGFALGLGQWSSWQLRAGEDGGLLGQVSSLPLQALASLSFCKKEVKGSKGPRGEGTSLPAERQEEGRTVSTGDIVSGGAETGQAGGHGLVPGRKSRVGDKAGLPARKVTGGRRDPAHAGGIPGPGWTGREEMGTQDTAGSPAATHLTHRKSFSSRCRSGSSWASQACAGASRAGERE